VPISIGNFKGGSAKTTSAIHIAAYMQTLGPTILGDGDIVRASVKWSARGTGMPFKVVPIAQLAKEMRAAMYDHVVIDAEANPSDENFKDIAKGCDLLVIPTEADSTARDRLIYTLTQAQGYRPPQSPRAHHQGASAAAGRSADAPR
jgi:chromosome partitioning protein